MLKSREAAEDVLQEACIRALTKIHQLSDMGKFNQWFGRICQNQGRNHLRARHLKFEELKDHHIEQTSKPCPIEKEKRMKELEIFAECLPERQRIAFELRVIHELEFDEIAWVMRCAFETAKANYRHAQEKYRRHIFEKQSPASF